MPSITSLGVGSGLDLQSLVDRLVAAERDPVVANLARKEAALSAELSGFGLLRSSLADFQGSFSALASRSNFQPRTASSSDSSIFTVSADSGAAEQSAQIEVTQTARAHGLATAAYSDENAVIGTGTLTVRFGTTSYDPNTDTYSSFTLNPDIPSQTLTIDSSNNTLSGLRDYINQNDFGFQASIVNDGTGYRLVLSADATGAASSLEITVTDTGDGNDTDTSGLSALAFNSAATNLEQTQAARDAILKVNGLTVTRSSNTISDLFDGVTLTLQKEAPGSLETLVVSRNDAAIQNSIQDFVDKYNSLVATINQLTAYNADTGEAGTLIGDTGVRNVSTRLSSLLIDLVPGLDGPYRALSDIGITTQSDGTLAIDTSRLSDAIKNNAAAVTDLFAPAGRPTDSGIRFSDSTSETRTGTYRIDISTLPTQGLLQGSGVLPADLATTPVVIDANNDTLTVKIDGIASDTIQLTQGSYTSGDTLAAMIQSQINADSKLKAAGVSVIVSYEAANQRLVLTSSRYGSASSVEITSVDGNTSATLGLSVGTGTQGVDVAGTIAGLPATGSGRILTSDSGDSKGLAIEVTGGSTGARGNVAFSTGLVSRLDSLVTGFLADDGLLKTREAGIESSLDDIGKSRERLDQRMTKLRERLVAQFSALDSLIASLQQTSNFLTQQLATIPKPGTGSSSR